MEDATAVDALKGTKLLFGEVAAWQSTLVENAIREGATWEEIGDALGTTRQAAWARFRSVAEKVEGLSVPSAQEVKTMTERVKEQLRDLQAQMKEWDDKWRRRQAELTDQARKLERERREERKQLQQDIRSVQHDLREEIRALRRPTNTSDT
jgi:chromosome segregation ATPase